MKNWRSRWAVCFVNAVNGLGDVATVLTDQMIGIYRLNPSELGSHGSYLSSGKEIRKDEESITVIGFDLLMGEAHRQTP
jgi:hypothetical protein